MDILKEFEAYIAEWCEKNNKPLFKTDEISKNWQLAWTDFMNGPLKERWNEIKNDYANMEFLTKTKQRQLEAQRELDEKLKEIDKSNEKTKPKSDWEVIQELMQ